MSSQSTGTIDRAAMGIEGLDDVLGGGLTRDRTYLIEGVPGSGKTTVALQFLLEGVKRGEPVLYVTLSETEGELRAAAASHGWDLEGVVIRELVRANSEMCRTMAEQFSDVMKATAEILRAADGAGLPRREPVPAAPVVEEDKDDDEEEDDDEDDEVDPQAHVWSLIEDMIPTIKMWIAAKVADGRKRHHRITQPVRRDHQQPLDLTCHEACSAGAGSSRHRRCIQSQRCGSRLTYISSTSVHRCVNSRTAPGP